MKDQVYFGMPPQKLSTSQKTKEWGERCVDSVINMASHGQVNNGRTSRQNKQANYDLYNSIFNEEDFNYVLDPYGVKDTVGGAPVKMQNYNIIRSKIELLKGEEMNRPFNFRVVATAGEALSDKVAKKREAIISMVQQMIAAEAGEPELDEEGNPIPPPTPAQLEKYFQTQYVDPREVTGNQILNYILKKEKLKMLFNQGWEHALISSEEIYYVGIVSGEPVVRTVNPLNFDFDHTSEVKFIEDAQWAKEERYLSVGAILDEYGEYLTETQIDKLSSGNLGGSYGPMGPGGQQQGFAYPFENYPYRNGHPSSSNHIYTCHVVWKTMTKIGFLSYIDPRTNMPETTIVDDSFKMTAELKAINATIDWQWINEVYQGTKIGNDIFVNIGPLENQSRSMENPSICKLPYVGYVYNNTNSKATSLVDLVKAHQFTYMVVWWRLESEIAKAKGKKFIMDMAMLPKSKGWTVDQWMYYFDNLGVAWINSMEEGREGDPNSVSKFNQFTDVDMTLSQSIQQYVLVLNKIEEMVATITGVSPQRESQVHSSETVGGVERSIAQSTHITEPLFYYHNEVKERVLTKVIDTARIAYAEGKKAQYVVDDSHIAMLNVDETFTDSEYGVFVSDSARDNQIKNKLEALAEVAIQQDKANLSDVISIYLSNSSQEIAAKIRQSEQDKYTRDSEQAQAQMKAEQEMAAREEALEREKMDREDLNKQLDREAKLREAEMKSLGMIGMQNPDVNQNMIPDVIEQGKLALAQTQEAFKEKAEAVKLGQAQEKMRMEKEIKEKELKIKEKELKVKEQDSANKLKIAKVNRNKHSK